MARSFSYSQGPIWEIVIPEYKSGSVGGGERYDGMIKRITGLDIPGTGIAFGFDRTLEALTELDLIKSTKNDLQILVTVFGEKFWPNSIQISKELRKVGLSCELYPDPMVKLDKQLKYANKKGILYIVIIGPDEIKQNKVMLKNMTSGMQKLLSLKEVVKTIQ